MVETIVVSLPDSALSQVQIAMVLSSPFQNVSCATDLSAFVVSLLAERQAVVKGTDPLVERA